MAKLKKIGILSLAKIEGLVLAIFGLVIGLAYAIIATIIGAATRSAGLAIGLGLLALIGCPILYGAAGFVGGALTAFVYNLVAGWTGGLEMDFDK